jgi:two-component system response regulator HydG
VRELENVVERAVILSMEEFILPDSLPHNIKQSAVEPNTSATDALVGRSIKDVEKELILNTLEQSGNNITRAAEILGLTRRGLQYKLKEMNIK